MNQLKMEGTMSEIRCFAGKFAPENWAFCEGQLLPINQYQELFSLLGTTYGGNGMTNFALPNLRGSAPIGAGTGTGLSSRYAGETGGAQQVVVSPDQLPPHNHPNVSPFALGCSSTGGVSTSPEQGVPATSAANLYSTKADSDMFIQHAHLQLQPEGGNNPHDNMPPYLGLNYIICLVGFYPKKD